MAAASAQRSLQRRLLALLQQRVFVHTALLILLTTCCYHLGVGPSAVGATVPGSSSNLTR